MGRTSRDKGKRTERAAVKKLARVWPECGRNLDQFSTDKRDCVNTPGFHWQVKGVERLSIWDALRQAEEEARDGDRPIVMFKRNRSRFYCALDAELLLDLIEAAQLNGPV